jgi:hypothetical protein
MITFDQFERLIAIVESSDNPNIGLGDNGRAAGRYQQHPSFYALWGPTSDNIRDKLGGEPNWDTCYRFALERFWSKRKSNDAILVAMAYHLHGYHNYNGDDKVYRTKLETIYKTITGDS